MDFGLWVVQYISKAQTRKTIFVKDTGKIHSAYILLDTLKYTPGIRQNHRKLLIPGFHDIDPLDKSFYPAALLYNSTGLH